MKKRKHLGILIFVLAFGCILLFSSAAINASEDGNSKAPENPAPSASAVSECPNGLMKNGGFRRFMFPDLAKAVSDNIITQAESDSIKTFLEGYKPERRTDIFSVLVTEKILTKDKADALKDYFCQQRIKADTQRLAAALDRLVSDGTITKEQSEKIIFAITKAREEIKAPGERPDILAALTEDGTITPDQAEKVKEIIRKGPHGPKGKGRHMECPGLSTDAI